ncbi:MAG: 50S ribosomal protein L20 [Candidatus Omnitrophica bacterium]|nr:50S ribosomal protein L20 [Candidatus Omnitrophota bacterium]
MARVRHSVATHKRKKRLLKKAKGYFLDRSKQYQQAKRTLDRALVYAYEGRKVKKRTFRSLWITRISAACREAGTTYSAFMNALKKAKVNVDRKILAELAAAEPKVFAKILEQVTEKPNK